MKNLKKPLIEEIHSLLHHQIPLEYTKENLRRYYDVPALKLGVGLLKAKHYIDEGK